MSRNYKSQLIRLCFVLPIVLLGACGDDDAARVVVVDNVIIKTGSFQDSAVSGISYETATQSGVTNSQGQFQYIEGEDITFSIGSIVLPTVPAEFVLTPIELVGNGATSSNITVLNIASLLQTIDTDNDPTNGIEINSEAISAATTGLDFTVTAIEFRDIASPAQLYIDSLNRDIDGTSLVIVAEAVAQAHLRVTIAEIEESDFSNDFLSGKTFSVSHSGNSVAELFFNSAGQTGTITHSGNVINSISDWAVSTDNGHVTFTENDESENSPTSWEFIDPTVFDNQAIYTYIKPNEVNDSTGSGTMTLIENAFIPSFIEGKSFLLTHRTSTFNLSFIETVDSDTDELTPYSGTITYNSSPDPDASPVGFIWSIDLGVLTITESLTNTDTTSWVFTATEFISEEEADYSFTLSGIIDEDSFAEIGTGNMVVIVN